MNTVELVYALKSRLYDNAINLYKDAYNKPVDGSDEDIWVSIEEDMSKEDIEESYLQ